MLKKGPASAQWSRGEAVEVSWGIRANHGGGCERTGPVRDARTHPTDSRGGVRSAAGVPRTNGLVDNALPRPALAFCFASRRPVPPLPRGGASHGGVLPAHPAAVHGLVHLEDRVENRFCALRPGVCAALALFNAIDKPVRASRYRYAKSA